MKTWKIPIAMILVTITLGVPFSYEQNFELDWTVEQNFGEWGHARFNITGDGYPEMAKLLGNRFEFYSATGSGNSTGYDLVWSLEAGGAY